MTAAFPDPYKAAALQAVARRFESGAWDDLDVRLLLQLATLAIECEQLAGATCEAFVAAHLNRISGKA